MCLRPRKSVKNGIALRNIINSAVVPWSATQNTQQREKAAFDAAVTLNRLNRVIGTTWIIPTARSGMNGNIVLIPTYGTNHPITVPRIIHE